MSSSAQGTTQHVDGQDHDRFATTNSLSNQLNAMSSNDGSPSEPVEITAVQKMISATSGSLLTSLLVTPLDVVRVRWQSQGVKQGVRATAHTADFSKLAVSTPNAFRPSNLGVTACCREVFFMNNNAEVCVVGGPVGGGGIAGSAATSVPADCAVEQTKQRMFNSTLDGLRKIARNEGVFTLWRGLTPTLVMAVPGNIIYFTGYEWLRYNRASPIARGVRDEYAPFVAGSAARVLAAAAIGPIELFRTRLQASQGSTARGHVADTFHSIRDMVGLHGYTSLWRGLTLTLWRDVPFSGMYWWGYETIRGILTDMREQARGRTLDLAGSSADRGRARRRSQSRENHSETFTDSFIAGAGSGAIASFITTPFDVGKTRTQVFRDAAMDAAKNTRRSAAVAPEEQNMVRLLRHIFSTEGMSGLFKGWMPRTLKVAPACAIMISSYEVGKRIFRGVNERALKERREREGR